MPKNKAPRKSKKPSQVRKNPSGILNRLTVPEERIQNLKRRAETELLRLYMRTGSTQDVLSLYTTLQLGKAMLKYISDPERCQEAIHAGEACLDRYDPESHAINLDAARDALNICCDIWRKVSVDEFVTAARELKCRETPS